MVTRVKVKRAIKDAAGGKVGGARRVSSIKSLMTRYKAGKLSAGQLLSNAKELLKAGKITASDYTRLKKIGEKAGTKQLPAKSKSKDMVKSPSKAVVKQKAKVKKVASEVMPAPSKKPKGKGKLADVKGESRKVGGKQKALPAPKKLKALPAPKQPLRISQSKGKAGPSTPAKAPKNIKEISAPTKEKAQAILKKVQAKGGKGRIVRRGAIFFVLVTAGLALYKKVRDSKRKTAKDEANKSAGKKGKNEGVGELRKADDKASSFKRDKKTPPKTEEVTPPKKTKVGLSKKKKTAKRPKFSASQLAKAARNRKSASIRESRRALSDHRNREKGGLTSKESKRTDKVAGWLRKRDKIDYGDRYKRFTGGLADDLNKGSRKKQEDRKRKKTVKKGKKKERYSLSPGVRENLKRVMSKGPGGRGGRR